MIALRQKILSVLLLLLCVTMTTAAEEPLRIRNCRPKLPDAVHLQQRRVTRGTGDVNPYIGDRRQLLVLVSFKDRAFKESNPLTLWNRVFNEPGFSELDFKGSVHDYFYAQSYGQFRLTFDIYYVALADSCSKYRSTYSDDDNSQYLVADVVDSLLARSIDWTPYDWNGDGYVNQLLMLYAGKGMNDGGGSNSIWPHQYWMRWHQAALPVVPAGDHTLLVDTYCCVQELNGKGTYGVFGTICHEYSHCFGFPDFYYGSAKNIGGWDLMDSGNYSGNGFCPPGYSAHERMLLGWMNPVELTEPADISQMQPLSKSPEAYLIRNDGYSREYYIVENRQQEGWDSYLPGRGIVVFHIDYDETIWLSGVPNTSTYKRYTIFPANNKTSVSYAGNWAYPYEGNDSLTNNSSPSATLWRDNTDGTQLMSKPLTALNISDGLASFTFMGGTSSAIRPTITDSSQPAKVLYRLGPVSILRYPNGMVKKVIQQP